MALGKLVLQFLYFSDKDDEIIVHTLQDVRIKWIKVYKVATAVPGRLFPINNLKMFTTIMCITFIELTN